MKKSEVMDLLKENQNERGIAHWATKKPKGSKLRSYGLGLTKLRKLARQIGRDRALAQQLWKSNVYDAKIIGLLIDDPKQLTRAQVEEQADGLEGGYLAHVFSACGATLPKSPIAFEVALDWRESDDPIRRRCAWGLIYELSKSKGKKAPSEEFFLECIDRIRNSIHQEEDMWVRESMNGALLGIGKRTKKLNTAAVRAARAIGSVDIDYGDDNRCEPLDVLAHLRSDYVKKKFG